ncbi:MAG: hypothetical protein H7Z11_21985 [Verrucomicrobia bacterium]|nr:hypothetical protein [Leptolyngbya sp. ES-bin-22]
MVTSIIMADAGDRPSALIKRGAIAGLMTDKQGAIAQANDAKRSRL